MPTIEMTPEQLQELLARAVGAAVDKAVAAAKAMNPLEQKRYNEEVDMETRKAALREAVSRDKERTRNARRNCTHSRDNIGKYVAKGTGVWTTSGQLHADDTISLLCLRCQMTWVFKSAPWERELFHTGEHGLLGLTPPADDRLLNRDAA